MFQENPLSLDQVIPKKRLGSVFGKPVPFLLEKMERAGKNDHCALSVRAQRFFVCFERRLFLVDCVQYY